MGMKNSNRDLLVLIKDETMSDHAIECEVKKLNNMLMCVESSEQCYNSYELMDMNNNKISRNSFKIRAVMREKQPKPFIFLSNLN